MFPINPTAILTDAHGVIYNESGPILSAIHRLNIWIQSVPVWVVTNNTTASPTQIATQLQHMGLAISSDAIISSGHGLALDPTCHHLVRGERVFTYGYPDSEWYVTHAGGVVTHEPDDATVMVIAASTNETNESMYAKVARSLTQNPHRPVIAINPDHYVSAGDGRRIPVAGYYAAQLEATLPISVRWMGKPMPAFSQVVRHVLNRQLGDLWGSNVYFFDDNPKNVLQLERDLGITGVGVRQTGLLHGYSDQRILQEYGVIPNHMVEVLQ